MIQGRAPGAASVPLLVAVTAHRDLVASEVPGLRERITAFLAGLGEHLHNLAVLDQHRVAPGTQAEAEVVLGHQHVHAAGEVAAAVRQQL